MEQIKSFQVDHDKIGIGMYLSRQDGDIATYDIRMCIPNGGEYLPNAAIHTIEHLFATYARNSAWADHVVYVGPMGCRTGFYLLIRDLPHCDVILLVRQSFHFIAGFSGDIPGVTKKECGNYKEHDLPGAVHIIAKILKKFDTITEQSLQYNV